MKIILFLLNVFIIIIPTYFMVKNLIYLRKGYTFSLLFIYPIIYAFNIFPSICHFIFGLINYKPFYDANVAMKDDLSVCIYLIFMLFCTLFLWLFNSTYNKVDVNKNLVIKDKKITQNCILILFLVPLIYFILNPSKWGGWLVYGGKYISEKSDGFPDILLVFGMICFFIHILISEKNKLRFLLLCFIMIFYIYLKGSRAMVFTTVIFSLFTLIMAKKINSKKAINIMFLSIFILIPFALWYSSIYRPSKVSIYEYLSIDLSRDYTTIYSIYREITKNMILDYRGQSFLGAFLIWVPRYLMEWKPYPFACYITNELLQIPTRSSIGTLGWGTTTGIFSEFIANLGWLGMPISIAFTQFFIWLADKAKKTETKFLIIFFLFYLFTVQFSAIAVPFLSFLLCYYVICVFQKESDLKKLKHEKEKKRSMYIK